MTSVPPDAHEWISFDDERRDRTWLFDVTFLESNWTCIFGRGCQGVLTESTPELAQGCCSYGAHFSSEKDRRRVEKAATRLSDDQWQFRAKGRRGTTRVKRNGEIVTRQVQGACIFLNRPDFARGPGCALHVLAMDNDESYIPLKPEVCWQLPLRREDSEPDGGRVVSTLRQWDRADWGPGGDEFAWWCTEAPEAFAGAEPVWLNMHDELEGLVGPEVMAMLSEFLTARQSAGSVLPPPVVRRRATEGGADR